MLYEYIINNYVPNEVILASELKACGKSDAAIRRELKKLTDAGKMERDIGNTDILMPLYKNMDGKISRTKYFSLI